MYKDKNMWVVLSVLSINDAAMICSRTQEEMLDICELGVGLNIFSVVLGVHRKNGEDKIHVGRICETVHQ